MVVPRTINDQEAGSSFSMSLEKEGNEKINNDCTRRSSCEWIFGQGFDSPRLHQKRNTKKLCKWLVTDNRLFFLFNYGDMYKIIKYL